MANGPDDTCPRCAHPLGEHQRDPSGRPVCGITTDRRPTCATCAQILGYRLA